MEGLPRLTNPHVIVTVPHVCLPPSARHHADPGCDFLSLRYAQAIHRAVPESLLISSQTSRALCDNNRDECRLLTPMRRAFTKAVQSFEGHPFLVLDIHTFSRGSDFDLSMEPHVVLLYLEGHRRLESRLFSNLSARGVRTVSLQGSLENDIMLEAVKDYPKGEAVLIEMRNSIDTRDTVFLHAILPAIVKTVHSK